jgi:hypothetical protein
MGNMGTDGTFRCSEEFEMGVGMTAVEQGSDIVRAVVRSSVWSAFG